MKKKIKIIGMRCSNCVSHIQKALTNLNGITSVKVKIGEAAIEYDTAVVDYEKIKEAITEIGYDVKK